MSEETPVDPAVAPPESIEEATKVIHGSARAIHEARKMHQPLIDSLEAEKSRIAELIEDSKARLAKDLEWPLSRIAACHHFLVQQGAAPKTFPTAHGVAKYSQPSKPYAPEIKETAVFMAWARTHDEGAGLWTHPPAPPRPEPKPDAVKVRQKLETWRVDGDRFITPDGEVVPGVVAVPTKPSQSFTPEES